MGEASEASTGSRADGAGAADTKDGEARLRAWLHAQSILGVRGIYFKRRNG